MGNSSVLWHLLASDIRNALGTRSCRIGCESPDANSPDAPGLSPREYACAALLRSIVKKFQDEIDRDAADSAAFAKFSEANAACSRQFELIEGELGPYDEIILGQFRQEMYNFFTPAGYPLLDLASIEANVDVGPGSTPYLEDTSFIAKLGEGYLTSSNSLLVELYDQWARSDPKRLDMELSRSLRYGPPFASCEAVRITPVPKTAKISRLVKVEPLLNMFFQKGIQRVLERRLKECFDIDLAIQPTRNSELARLGSLVGEPDPFATIDLSSASDYISYGFAKTYVPKASMKWLEYTRSQLAVIGDSTDGTVCQLDMLATMGNAWCFPFQTAVFACAVVAVYKCLGLPLTKEARTLKWRIDESSGEVASFKWERPLTPMNYGVFGDDIVVRDCAYWPVIRLLKAFGMKPNVEKSYNSTSGYFRESCGTDWYVGTNVRGVYCKSLKTMQDRYVLINSLTDWSATHNVPLSGTIKWLVSRVRVTPVPVWENPDAGIRMPLRAVDRKHIKVCGHQEKDVRFCGSVLETLNRLSVNYQGSYLYQCWWAPPVQSQVDTEESFNKSGYGNTAALLIAASRGILRGGKNITRKHGDRVSYRKLWKVGPSWDHPATGKVRGADAVLWYQMATGYFSKETILEPVVLTDRKSVV